METRVAVLAVIIEDKESAETVNGILHDFGDYVIGRMGLPYKRRNINILSVAVDAPQDMISSLAGRLGAVSGVSVKTAYSNYIYND